MSPDPARLEPTIDSDHETAPDGAPEDPLYRPAASLTGSMISRPPRADGVERAGEPDREDATASTVEAAGAARADEHALEPEIPADRGEAGTSVRAIRQSLRANAGESEPEPDEPEPARSGIRGGLSWADLVIYTAAYLMFLLLAIYFLDLI